MATEAVIIGERMEDLIAAAASLRPNAARLTALQTRDVARRAQTATAPRALVLFLTDRDNLAELRAVLQSATGRVLLVAPRSPPSAALARVATQFGAGLCGRDDPLAVREAMLVALAAGRATQEAS
jgi:hypothetical protein